jgi:hypothetical protein
MLHKEAGLELELVEGTSKTHAYLTSLLLHFSRNDQQRNIKLYGDVGWFSAHVRL